MTGLLLAASAFFLLHLVPSAPFRRKAIAIAGERAYMAAFAILSLAALACMITQFNATPYGSKLWLVPEWWPWLQAILILFSLLLSVCGILTPNPSLPGTKKALANADAAGGAFAITRHPVMWGAAIWAAAHAITLATVRGLLFFGAFAATALIGSWLQERRKRAGSSAWTAFEAKTSFFPFAAIIEGRAKLSLRATGWWRLAIAFLLCGAILHFHVLLFGAQPLPIYSWPAALRAVNAGNAERQ